MSSGVQYSAGLQASLLLLIVSCGSGGCVVQSLQWLDRHGVPCLMLQITWLSPNLCEVVKKARLHCAASVIASVAPLVAVAVTAQTRAWLMPWPHWCFSPHTHPSLSPAPPLPHTHTSSPPAHPVPPLPLSPQHPYAGSSRRRSQSCISHA